MQLTDIYNIKLDRSAGRVINKGEDETDTAKYWAARTPKERLVAAEFLRRQWMEWNNLSDKMEKVVSFKPLHE